MAEYKNILVATDLGEDTTSILRQGIAIAGSGDVQLHLIHVIEPLSFAYGGDIPMDFSGIQEEIHQQASQQMLRVSEAYNIDAQRQYIVLGKPEVEIHVKAAELGADLIVVGSHGRHGLALLMGSTANGVLHGATCDVLAVRVGQDT